MKIRRIFAVVLAILSLGIFASCAPENGKDDDSATVFEPTAYVQKFDNYMDMYNCGFVNFYGKIDLTEEHAVAGTAAKMQIGQLLAYSADPCMHLDLNREDYGYDYSDLSMINQVGFYVYNANDFDGILNFKITGTDGSDLINEFYTLAPNCGEKVSVKIDRSYMKLNNVPAAKLRFSVNAKENSVWYFDEIYVEKAYAPIVIENRAFDTNNLLDFNNPEDINYVVTDSVIGSTAHIVNYRIAADAGIVKDASALKVEFLRKLNPDNDYTVQPQYYYGGITLSKVFYDNFDFAKLWTNDFCVDVYSTMNKSMTFILRITDGVGTVFDKEYTVAPNEWNTLRLNFNDCGEDTTMRLEHIAKVSVYVNYQEMDGDTASFYLDNMRLEEIKA